MNSLFVFSFSCSAFVKTALRTTTKTSSQNDCPDTNKTIICSFHFLAQLLFKTALRTTTKTSSQNDCPDTNQTIICSFQFLAQLLFKTTTRTTTKTSCKKTVSSIIVVYKNLISTCLLSTTTNKNIYKLVRSRHNNNNKELYISIKATSQF